MKLLTKFNLILVVVFGAAGFLIAHLAYDFLIGNARREVLAQAQLMMHSATSVRNYTNDDLKPLLEKNPQHRVRFLAETVPGLLLPPPSAICARVFLTTCPTRTRKPLSTPPTWKIAPRIGRLMSFMIYAITRI
jgi:hypothetical protein